MKHTLLIPAFVQITATAFKNSNYADMLFPGKAKKQNGTFNNSRNDMASIPRMLRMSVRELLEMNHQYISSRSSDDDSYYTEHFSSYPYDDSDFYLDNSGDEDYPDDVTRSESLEGLLEEMLGTDFFESRKFSLFLVLSGLLCLLLVSCCLASLCWCWCQGKRGGAHRGVHFFF